MAIRLKTSHRHTLRNGFGNGASRNMVSNRNRSVKISRWEIQRLAKKRWFTAKLCHIHGFVSPPPRIRITVISDDGGDFARAKQLLCIACAKMMGQPNMLILDEATSSIDTRTELKIQEAFNIWWRDARALSWRIVCRPFVIADVILVLKDGHVIEKGNHASLMEQRGFYHNLYQSQWQIVTIKEV